jgi:hypothetical protein
MIRWVACGDAADATSAEWWALEARGSRASRRWLPAFIASPSVAVGGHRLSLAGDAESEPDLYDGEGRGSG